MSLVLSKASLSKLKGVHPDLVRVVKRCAADWKPKDLGFIVTCGVRTVEEQRKLVKAGASRTMNSRHIPAKNGFSHAVDVAATIDGKVRWDWPCYDRIFRAMSAAAKAEGVPLEWGGLWQTFKDGPHYQLPRKIYNGTK